MHVRVVTAVPLPHVTEHWGVPPCTQWYDSVGVRVGVRVGGAVGRLHVKNIPWAVLVETVHAP